MKHVAIDLGGRESQICVRHADGSILDEKKVPTRKLPELFKEWSKSRIVVETSAEAFRIADSARAATHEVRVVPSTLVHALGVGARGIKTDRRDARSLSLASCQMDLPSVHLPSEMSRRLKSICGSRERLVECRTVLINNVRGWMRTQLIRIRTGGAVSFADRVRTHLQKDELELPEHIDRELDVIATLSDKIRLADKQLAKLAKEHPVCRRLMTAPGIGVVTATRFVAAIDDVTRFHTAHALQSYLGLTPGEKSSGDSSHRKGITKAGPSAVRWALIQAAWATIRHAPTDPMVRWSQRIADRRGKFIAVTALARKLAGILFAMWRDGTDYRSSRSARTALDN